MDCLRMRLDLHQAEGRVVVAVAVAPAVCAEEQLIGEAAHRGLRSVVRCAVRVVGAGAVAIAVPVRVFVAGNEMRAAS